MTKPLVRLAIVAILASACAESDQIDWQADAEYWHVEYQDSESRAAEAERRAENSELRADDAEAWAAEVQDLLEQLCWDYEVC